MTHIIAVANQKGGVGKTTTAVNLAASLAHIGFEVLLVDMDAQGNATSGLGIDKQSLEKTMYHVLVDEFPLEQIVQPTVMEGLDIAPASVDLVGAEIELVPLMSREQRLAQAMNRVTAMYNYIIIDCPPSLGMLTINSLTAAQKVLIPIQCEYYALEGLGLLMNTINAVQQRLNPRLTIEGVVLTMYDSRTNLADHVVQNVKTYFPERVYETIIPRNVRLSESPSFGKPVILHDKYSRGATAYLALAQEVSGTDTVDMPVAHAEEAVVMSAAEKM